MNKDTLYKKLVEISLPYVNYESESHVIATDVINLLKIIRMEMSLDSLIDNLEVEKTDEKEEEIQ